MRYDQNGFAKKKATLLRIRCIEECTRGKAIKIHYGEHTFWLPHSWCRKIEKSDDGYVRITLPDWALAMKIEEAKFEAIRGTTRGSQRRRASRYQYKSKQSS